MKAKLDSLFYPLDLLLCRTAHVQTNRTDRNESKCVSQPLTLQNPGNCVGSLSRPRFDLDPTVKTITLGPWAGPRVFEIQLFFSFCIITFVIACRRLSPLEMLIFIQEGAQHCLLQLTRRH